MTMPTLYLRLLGDFSLLYNDQPGAVVDRAEAIRRRQAAAQRRVCLVHRRI
ncbi:MAG: hypothetical protein ACJ788_07265 [Ktedonobacteraceae bacterium]